MAVSLSAYAMRRHCEKLGIAPSTFGRQAIGDPSLIRDVANGRELSPATAERIADFMGAPTSGVAKGPCRKPIDAHPVLIEVEAFLAETGMTATQFGIAALADPKLVFDLRDGRDPRRPTVARIRQYIETGEEL